MMEDYNTFLQHRLSHLKKSEEEEEHNKPPSSSLIRFYGQPILPPLLSGEQREEMQRHRAAAQEAAVLRKLKDDSRMASVQTILHSVQLRKTPTLEELLQESEINTKFSYSHNTRSKSVLQSDLLIGTKDSLSLFLPPGKKEKDGVSLPPLTSTTYSAFFTSNVTPQQSYLEGSSQQGSQPSHQSVSSGYVTYDNVENTPNVSGRIDAEKESHVFSSSEGAYENSMGGFFLHNSSNTITKMPDIISHPPVDGDELERGGSELPNCNNFIVVTDVCCFSLQEDSVTCDHFPIVKSENSHLDSTEDGDKPLFTTALDLDKDHSSDKIEGLISLAENSGISDNQELSQTLSTHCSSTTELHIQNTPTEPADNHVDEEKPSEEPYRLSLQALLKKSQEYRRHQRLLRNQAKNTKIQERTREQMRARAEEQSLSDKENDEFPDKGVVHTEGKTTKERRGTSVLSVETSPQKSWEPEKRTESEIDEEKANFESTRDGYTNEMTSVEEEAVFKNNKLNVSQEVITALQQINIFPQQQPTTETSPPQEAFNLTTCPASFYNGIGKYHTFPAPNLCRSPVHCKGRLQDGEALNGAEISNRKVLVGTGSNEGHKVEVNVGHESSTAAVPSIVNLREGDLTCNSARSSPHIDQLESNMSSLKFLISDLESSLTENLKTHGQTESNAQSESTFKGIRRSCQSDCDKVREDGDGSDAEQDQIYEVGLRRQSLNNLRNKQAEDKRPESSIGDTNSVPHIVQVEEAEAVNLSELRLVKTLAAERGKEKGTYKEGLTKSYGQHGGCRMSTAKHILSATQRLRIPDVFRPTAPRSASVLSDTSNRQVENGNETPAEGLDSTCSPSLNQSYDVDAPSDLWLLKGSGSDSGSKGHLVQETHLTPESVGKGQGGVSKVKRRLLMHMTEEAQERSANRGPYSLVRPNSSTPRAAARWYEVLGRQEDKQEQLKRAHAAQIRALQEEHKRQQEELLQALAVRYRLLQSVSFPCSMSSSRLGDTLTFSTLSQTSSQLSECYRHLLLAAVKGFLVRRLLRTERVAQLVRTFRDTHQVLQALQQQSPGSGEFCSRQDLLLQERVTLQLRAARYEVHDIFFSLSAGEQMLLIRWDRELTKERELRRRSGHSSHPRGKSSLSTATQKSLERKRVMMIQKKAADRHKGVVMGTGRNTGFSAEPSAETKRGQFRANPQRVFKSTCSSRPR